MSPSSSTVRRALGTFALIAAIVAPPIVAPAFASAAELSADPPHTSATFSVKHLTLTTITGTIGVKSATISTTPDGLLTAVKATLDLATIDTKFADRDADLRSDRWFGVAANPDMTFASTKISGEKNAMTVVGNLTFHGKTNPVTLVAKFEGSIKDQRGRTHVGYSATGTIDRLKWDVGPSFPPAIVGDDIAITIEMEAVSP